uniref:Methyltransferase domain-containing protein n=1 Tax=Tetranychus urticae TaxID=32264 RepID=T1KRI3_TETUR
MNNDPQLYDKSNGLQKKDSEYLLKRLEKDFQNVSPKVIVDIGCGPGNITQMIYSSFPDSRIIGFDCSEKMIFTSTFCLHWVTNTAKAMENTTKRLKPDGKCYLLMFSWNSILPLQEQITYQEPWYEFFRKLEVPMDNEKPIYPSRMKIATLSRVSRSLRYFLKKNARRKICAKSDNFSVRSFYGVSVSFDWDATNSQSDKSIKSELTRRASTSQLADSQHLLGLAKPKSKSSKIRRKLSVPFPVYEIPPGKERIDHWVKFCETANLKPNEMAIHDSTFNYEDIEGFKSNTSGGLNKTKYLSSFLVNTRYFSVILPLKVPSIQSNNKMKTIAIILMIIYFIQFTMLIAIPVGKDQGSANWPILGEDPVHEPVFKSTDDSLSHEFPADAAYWPKWDNNSTESPENLKTF